MLYIIKKEEDIDSEIFEIISKILNSIIGNLYIIKKFKIKSKIRIIFKEIDIHLKISYINLYSIYCKLGLTFRRNILFTLLIFKKIYRY
jgi:hypothetical protein